MESRKNKKLFNTIMVVVIVLVAAAGIVAVGAVKGWFTGSDEAFAEAKNVSGIVSVERSGVSFEAKNGDSLMSGDTITTNEKAQILISAGDNTYNLAEASQAKLEVSDESRYIMELVSGESFVIVDDEGDFQKIIAQDNEITSEKAVFSVNVQTGSMGINVFYGSVTAARDGESLTAQAGEKISIVGEEMEVAQLSADSLNQFNLENAIDAGKSHELCFSEEELNKVIEDRAAEAGSADEEDGESSEGDTSSGNDSESTNQTGNNPGSSLGGNGSSGTSSSSGSSGSSGNSGSSSDSGSSSGSGNSNDGQSGSGTKYDYSCTIEIRCDTILNNMDKLTSGKEGYVPSDGTILRKTTVGFNEGETVFDVLQRACNSKGIQMEASWSPAYGSSYIEGINHLYEFDCGPQSGWMYKVNGWFPNYGCSSYKLKDGDSIVWLYSCEGLGADVGGSANW